MNDVSLQIREFIKENKFKYLEFLSEIGGFPFVCDISSSIMGVYLFKRYGVELYHIDGDYDDEIHHWLQFNDGTILDFVGFQFDDILVGKNLKELKPLLDKNYPFVKKSDNSYNNYCFLSEQSYDTLLESLYDLDFTNYLKQVTYYLMERGYIDVFYKLALT